MYYTPSDTSDYSAYAKNALWKRYGLQCWNLSKEGIVEKRKWCLHLNCRFNTRKHMKAVPFSKETEWPLTPTECKPGAQYLWKGRLFKYKYGYRSLILGTFLISWPRIKGSTVSECLALIAPKKGRRSG